MIDVLKEKKKPTTIPTKNKKANIEPPYHILSPFGLASFCVTLFPPPSNDEHECIIDL
jgi:hypothetical protein